MKPLTFDQIVPFGQWERVRPLLRPLFIQEKERRRLAIGPHLTLLFENAQTVWYQIEEILRVEHISEPTLVQHELDTYNELLPARDELSATLFVEYPDPVERDAALRDLIGLEHHVWLRVGTRRIAGRFEERQIGEDRISSVQFVRFALSGHEPLTALAAASELAVEVDHPVLSVRAVLDRTLAHALAGDLAADDTTAGNGTA